MKEKWRDIAKELTFEADDDYLYEVYEQEYPRRFLGLTSAQRFIISLLLLGAVSVIGVLCLLVTEKIWIFS
jgi:hypothetical protein